MNTYWVLLTKCQALCRRFYRQRPLSNSDLLLEVVSDLFLGGTDFKGEANFPGLPNTLLPLYFKKEKRSSLCIHPAWWAAIYGVAQSLTRLKRLSSSSSSRSLQCCPSSDIPLFMDSGKYFPSLDLIFSILKWGNEQNGPWGPIQLWHFMERNRLM